MQARKSIAARAACKRERVGFALPKSIQRPQMGRKRTRVGLERKIIAHRMAKMAQRMVGLVAASVGQSVIAVRPAMPRMRRAITKVQAKRPVVRDVSHTQWTAYWLAAGYKAQSQPDQRGTLRFGLGLPAP